jgi:hypothetical protein
VDAKNSADDGCFDCFEETDDLLNGTRNLGIVINKE